GVAFPVTAGITHPELHVRRNMRPPVEWNDSIRMVFVPDEHHRTRNLNDSERRHDGVQPRNTRKQASMLGVDVLGPAWVFVIRLLPLLPGGGPRLVRKQPVGR